MAEWYLRSDYDQAKLSRILDIAQDLKALPLLLNAASHAFIIDLACLASRREFLKLDKWLGDKIREHGEPFVSSLVKVITRRVPQLLGKDETSSKAQLPPEVINIIIQCLHQCVNKVSIELSDTIVALSNTYNIIVNKPRGPGGPVPPPPNLQQPPGVPGVLRSHRSMDQGGFGVQSPTTPNQLFQQQQGPNDSLSNLNSTLAGLNLAGVGSFGVSGMNVNPLGPTPGSPSRLLGPNFSAPQNSGFPGLTGIQLNPQPPPPPSASNRNASTPPMGMGNPLMGMLSSSSGGGRFGSQTSQIMPQQQSGRGGVGGGGGSGLGLSGDPSSYMTDSRQLFTEIQPHEISREAEDEANSYFHRIYSKPPVSN